MKDTLTLNLSKSPITNNENSYLEITRQDFWKQFFKLSGQELSDKELEVISLYMIDEVPLKIPNTVITSLNKKGLLLDRQLSISLILLKDKIIQNNIKLIFNYEIRE